MNIICCVNLQILLSPSLPEYQQPIVFIHSCAWICIAGHYLRHQLLHL